MKKYILLILTSITCSLLCAQVGIGTTTPTEMLDVSGSVLLTDTVEVNGLSVVSSTDENFKLLTRVKNSTPSGEIKKLEVNNLTVTPIRVQNYSFINLNNDDITDVDLQLSTNDYIVSISNFKYNGASLIKVPALSSGLFSYKLFKSGGTWHLSIGNQYLNPALGGGVTYDVTLNIYQKKFFRELPVITTDLGVNNTGVASSVPTL
ncbi:MAG: hypothetical protein ACPG45_08230 [Flavobacteriaceae bacterium]